MTTYLVDGVFVDVRLGPKKILNDMLSKNKNHSKNKFKLNYFLFLYTIFSTLFDNCMYVILTVFQKILIKFDLRKIKKLFLDKNFRCKILYID